MARYVVDAGAAIEIARGVVVVAHEHELLAPTLIRSQVLSMLHEAVTRSELDADEARELLGRIRALRLRLLGDAVLQRRAWELADRLGWSETYAAEYLALTQLQADAFVTTDERLALEAATVVRVANVADLG